MSNSSSALAHPNSVTLAYTNCPVPNGLVVADKFDFLSKVGINLEDVDGQHGTIHVTNDHPTYTRYGGDIPPLVSEARAPGRTRLLGITPLLAHPSYFVRGDSPIKKPADLAGRRIGVSDSATRILRGKLGNYRELDPLRQTLVALGTWEARALLHTLEAGNLTLDDVELVEVESPGPSTKPEQLQASKSLKTADLIPDAVAIQAAILDEGRADAIFSWIAWGAELEARGARRILDLGQDSRNAYAMVWTISSDLVTRQPEVVQRLVDAVVDASIWSRHHLDEVARVHASNIGVSELGILNGFDPDFHRHLVPALDSSALSILKQTQDYLVNNHLLDQPIDLAKWAAPEFLVNSLKRTDNARKTA